MWNDIDEKILDRRISFLKTYSKKMSWTDNPHKLTSEQIGEIIKQKEWKEIPKLVREGK
jgi:hypothetical protein